MQPSFTTAQLCQFVHVSIQLEFQKFRISDLRITVINSHLFARAMINLGVPCQVRPCFLYTYGKTGGICAVYCEPIECIVDPTSHMGSSAIYFENVVRFQKWAKENQLPEDKIRSAITDFVECAAFVDKVKWKGEEWLSSGLDPEWIRYAMQCEARIQAYLGGVKQFKEQLN